MQKPNRILAMLVLLGGGALPSDYRFKEDASGVFARTLFSGAGPENTVVTIRDIMVGPRRSQTVPAAAGPAILEWFEGHGTYSMAGGKRLPIGNELGVIPAGQALVVNNPHGQAIGFRLYMFAGN